MGVRCLVKVLDFNKVRRYNLSRCYCFGRSFKPGCSLVRSMSSQLSPPSSVRGMTDLNRDLFDKGLSVPCIVVPVFDVDNVRPVLKPYLLKIPNFRPVQEIPCEDERTRGKISFPKQISYSSPSKIVILDPIKVTDFNDISEAHRETLSKFGIVKDNFVFSSLTIGYDNWKADEILRAVIPEEYDSVSGYSICGHIVHLNLREHLKKYKRVIGDVLLEKVVNARTVVNKTDNIDSTYRTFSMEVICGDNDTIATVKENKCTFKFDFSKVYWNSRLSTEHERIVSLIKKGDVLYDVFCGVGPFAIPASKNGCRVLANDLNPESIKWLEESAKINKTKFDVYNKDGRDFIIEDVKADILKIDENFKGNVHIVMNLPAIAVEFLSALHGLFQKQHYTSVSKLAMMVHVYCFTKGEDKPKEAALKLVEDKLDFKLNDNLINVYFVRNVAPMKEMMRVSFKLSTDITISSGKHPLDKETDKYEQIKRLHSETVV